MQAIVTTVEVGGDLYEFRAASDDGDDLDAEIEGQLVFEFGPDLNLRAEG